MIMQSAIEAKLTSVFNIDYLSVSNESHRHNVAPGSESHFKVTVVSNDFTALTLIKRHRLVNSTLAEILQQIHALALHTFTPIEWSEREGKVADSPDCRGGGKNQ